MKKEFILRMKDITKRFPGVLALDKVDFDLMKGEVHGLMGENGAGKSTLMKVLIGLHSHDGGTIQLEDRDVNFVSTREAMAAGISMIHQELNLMPEMTVAENIFMGREPEKCGFVNYREMNQQTQELLDMLDLGISPSAKLKSLTIAGQQMVEIVKAVSRESNILIMDEPTSALSDQEVERLFSIIQSLKEDGRSIIYISHRMDEIYRICDRISVLRDGQKIVTDTVSVLKQEALIDAMVGRTLEDYYPKEHQKKGDVVLQVNHLSVKDTMVDDISFSVRAGEVVGFAGMMGSGRTETCEAIFGIRKRKSGKLFVNGRESSIHSPYSAMKHGFAYVSEDRKQFGLFLIGSVRDNVVLSALKRLNKSVLIRDQVLDKTADDMIETLSIKTAGREVKTESLSGGNQQKVVLGKWLLTEAKLLILDEPTRGIDIGAKTEIYKLINQLTQKGLAIIMVSSEMPEVIGMSDRIYVFSEGKITAEFNRDEEEVTQEAIMRYASSRKG